MRQEKEGEEEEEEEEERDEGEVRVGEGMEGRKGGRRGKEAEGTRRKNGRIWGGKRKEGMKGRWGEERG